MQWGRLVSCSTVFIKLLLLGGCQNAPPDKTHRHRRHEAWTTTHTHTPTHVFRYTIVNYVWRLRDAMMDDSSYMYICIVSGVVAGKRRTTQHRRRDDNRRQTVHGVSTKGICRNARIHTDLMPQKVYCTMCSRKSGVSFSQTLCLISFLLI